MTIAIDARIINSTTGRYVERLLHYLQEIDSQNNYLVLVRQQDRDYFKPTSPNFKIVIADFANYSFDEQIGLATLLQKLKPDLVHFCMPQQPLLYTGPAITTVHDLNLLRITTNDDMGPAELAVKKQIFRGLLYMVARRAKHIITPTQYTKQDLLKFSGIKPAKVTVTLEGGLEITTKPTPIKKYQGVKFIMCVGRAEPYKNNRGLIKAHQMLLKKHPDLRLVIVGKIDTLRQSDIKWVKQNGYKNVDFTGFVSDQQAAWLYGNCQAYVFASYMEGFGLPALEAMTYGAPVVSSNATCLPEVCGPAAHYFDPGSIDDMTRAIEDVLINKTLRKKLIAAGAVQHKKYSWERMAEQTLNVYKKASR